MRKGLDAILAQGLVRFNRGLSANAQVAQAGAIDFTRRIVTHGDFSRRYSDVDIVIVTEAGPSRRRTAFYKARQQLCQLIGD
jgi:hypothetical protein